jgi:hypothetical protein
MIVKIKYVLIVSHSESLSSVCKGGSGGICKRKGKFVHVLNQALGHEDVSESELSGGDWSASHPGCFTPREKAPDTHWIGGGVGCRTGLDVLVKGIKSLLLPGIEPQSSSPYFTILTELSQLFRRHSFILGAKQGT